MKQQILLLEDVEGLGRSGDLVGAKPGYIRNFLLPQQKAVVATAHTLRMQTRLKEERAKQAALDRKDAEAMAGRLQQELLSIKVKVDAEGKMYGSVSAAEVVHLLQARGYEIERRHVALAHPLKVVGKHTITFKLKEGVPATCLLEILSEGEVVLPPEQEGVVAPLELP